MQKVYLYLSNRIRFYKNQRAFIKYGLRDRTEKQRKLSLLCIIDGRSGFAPYKAESYLQQRKELELSIEKKPKIYVQAKGCILKGPNDESPA